MLKYNIHRILGNFCLPVTTKKANQKSLRVFNSFFASALTKRQTNTKENARLRGHKSLLEEMVRFELTIRG